MNFNYSSLEKYKNSFIDSCKGFINYNHIVTDEKIKKSGDGKNEKILIDYFKNSISNEKINTCKKVLAAAAPEEFKKLQDKKAAPEEFFKLLNSCKLNDKFSTEFYLVLSKKYWNLNTLFDIVIKKNFDEISAAAKKDKKAIVLKNSDFLSLSNIDNVMLYFWNKAKAAAPEFTEFDNYQLVRDYSKKSSYIVRLSGYITDYYTIKAAPKKSNKAAAPEKNDLEIVAAIPDNENCIKSSTIENSVMLAIKKAAPEIRITAIDNVINQLNSYKSEFENSPEYKAAIEKKSAVKTVDKSKKSGKKSSSKKTTPENKNDLDNSAAALENK